MKVGKVDLQVHQIFAMSQVIEKVVEVIVLLAVKDECCQTAGHHGDGLSGIERVAFEMQKPEGGEFALKERATRGVWSEGGCFSSLSHPHCFEYGSQPVEERANVPESMRRWIEINGPHSVGVAGDE